MLSVRRADTHVRLSATPVAQSVFLARTKNAAGWASTFRSRWITPGLVNYRDVGAGVGYVSKEAIDRSMQSMVGRPLVIKHEPISDVTGQPVDPVRPANMDEVACGYISRVYWGDDGWAWLEGTCHDDEAKQLARETAKGGRGWKVSCCYEITSRGPAGRLNGMPYDFEVRQFNGEHLALHPNPRYEGATILMNGQKTQTTTAMFKLFGPKKTEASAADKAAADKAAADKLAADAAAEAARLANAKEGEPIEISADTKVQIDDKSTATIGELVASHLSVQNGMEMDPEQEIEYAEGKRAKAGVIMKHYANAMEEEEKKQAKNALDLEKENLARVAKATTTGTGGLTKNATGQQHPNFLRIIQAPARAAEQLVIKNSGLKIETQATRIARGQARWGKPAKSSSAAQNN